MEARRQFIGHAFGVGLKPLLQAARCPEIVIFGFEKNHAGAAREDRECQKVRFVRAAIALTAAGPATGLVNEGQPVDSFPVNRFDADSALAHGRPEEAGSSVSQRAPAEMPRSEE